MPYELSIGPGEPSHITNTVKSKVVLVSASKVLGDMRNISTINQIGIFSSSHAEVYWRIVNKILDTAVLMIHHDDQVFQNRCSTEINSTSIPELEAHPQYTNFSMEIFHTTVRMAVHIREHLRMRGALVPGLSGYLHSFNGETLSIYMDSTYPSYSELV